MKAALGRLLALGAVVGLGLALAGLAGGLHWLLDLCSHFRPHLVLAGALGLMLALPLRRWRTAGCAAAILGVCLPGLLPLYRAEAPGEGAALQVLMANVNCHYGDPVAVAKLLAASDVDVVGLVEVDERWIRALEPQLTRWPHRFVHPRDDNFGLALFSRTPLTETRVLTPRLSDVPALMGRVEVGGLAVDLVLVHPPPPVSRAIAAERDDLLGALARERPNLAERVVILGDFNATPWSVPFGQLLAQGHLREARDAAGAGISATWPTHLPTWLRIPIDHVLVGGPLGVVDFAVGPDIGSDHRPVTAHLRLQAQP